MINEINMYNVACYKNSSSITFDKKVSLIYGLNGSGKSTVSSYLSDPSAVKYKSCKINVDADATILVYNSKFVQDNFYESNSLQGVFSLSKENKHIEESIGKKTLERTTLIEALKGIEDTKATERNKLQKLTTQAQETIWDVKKTYSGGDRVLEYCLQNLKGNKETLFNYITAITKPEIEPLRGVAELKIEVESLANTDDSGLTRLPVISTGSIPSDEAKILNQLVLGSNSTTASELIEKLKNSSWVRAGLSYIDHTHEQSDPPCPFCQRSLPGEIIANIKGYFDEAYDIKIALIKSLRENFASFQSNIPNLDIYKEHTSTSPFIAEIIDSHAQLLRALQNSIDTIDEKLAQPNLPYSLDSLVEPVKKFNFSVELANIEIDQFNAKIARRAAELGKLKEEFWRIIRWQYDQTLVALDTASTITNKTIAALNSDARPLQEKLDELTEEISSLQSQTVNIQDAIDSIKSALVDLGISGFTIEKHSDVLYKLVRPEASEGVFTSLSEGEKMMISFLYFRELCKGKRSSTEVDSKKVVVIDDPVSSLSHIFMYNIGRLIKKDFFESDKYAQIIILTHSLYFFYELTETRKENRDKNQQLIRITKNVSGSSFTKMKYEEIQNDYQAYWSIINDQDQHPALIANCMRNIVEYFFNFVQKSDLSNVMQKPELQGNRFQSFCRYINRESHSLGQNIFDLKEFDYNIFRDGLKLTFELTGYSDHYKKMAKI